ncbi:hypothetical protein M422DRAFT_241166 [Sphaerobolus stellatus SS14]|nr:hypothetical protein M422DRAFT_241166 [Sphaerobolus stellatus SS14]
MSSRRKRVCRQSMTVAHDTYSIGSWSPASTECRLTPRRPLTSLFPNSAKLGQVKPPSTLNAWLIVGDTLEATHQSYLGMLRGLLDACATAAHCAEDLALSSAIDGEASHKEPWFIFFNSTPPPYPLLTYASLTESLDVIPDLIPTRWLNAILRRLSSRRMGNRSFNDEARKAQNPLPQIRRRPLLKQLTPHGEAIIGVDIAYNPLPSDKDADAEKEDIPYEVSLVLAVIVKKLVGNMIVKVHMRVLLNKLTTNVTCRLRNPFKPPVIHLFTTLFQTEISIESVAFDLQIRWGMVPLRHPTQTQGDPRSGIFTDAFACPTTMTTAVTTTVTTPEKSIAIKDEVSIKVDESLHLPGSFGGMLNDAEMDTVGLGA